MEGSRRRRGDGCTIVQCYTPRRFVGRWLSGLRSSKGKRDAGEEQEDEPETNTFGENLVFFFFIHF